MPAPTIMTITTEGSLVLADDEAGLAAGNTFSCQVTSAAITAVPNLQTTPATFCNPETETPAATGWQLVVSWLQDWTAPEGGLSGYAFDNDTAEKWFELKPSSDAEPTAVGIVRLVAGAFLGDAGTPLVASATWPLAAKPTITYPPAAIAGAAEEPEAEPAAEPEPVA
jgi:hypothetical protein